MSKTHLSVSQTQKMKPRLKTAQRTQVLMDQEESGVQTSRDWSGVLDVGERGGDGVGVEGGCGCG